jgi:flavin-dependent dehydrogenase
VNAAVVSGPSGREVTFPLPERDGSFAVTARRYDLDAALVDVVRATGVTVLEGHPVTSVREGADSIELGSADGMILRARHVVAADGMWSPVRKLLGVGEPDYRGEWHAFRQYFTGVSPRAERELRVWFEPDFLPGYAWSFPLGDGRANVGFGIRRGGSYEVGDMKHLWSDILGRPSVRAFLGPDAQPESVHKAWPIPARVDDTVLSRGRVLFAGDAAAATDPMTGEGIGQALATGIWAAEAISSFGPSPNRVAEAYERRVRRDLAPDHQLARLLVRALRHRRGARTALWAASLTEWTRRSFARWLFEDYPRAVLLTPHRWHAGMLHGHGAYRTPQDRPLHFADGSTARNAAATNGS